MVYINLFLFSLDMETFSYNNTTTREFVGFNITKNKT
jgi:hypothetical protein